MNIEPYIKQRLPSILEIARLAPSVHNSQPFKVSVINDTIKVSLDPKYTLKEGDPTGRQTIISLGIFSEAVSLSAQSQELQTIEVTLDNKSSYIKMGIKGSANKASQEAINFLKQRCSDRSYYKPVNISALTIKAIEGAYPSQDVKILVVSNPDLLGTISSLTAKGIGLALSNPVFRKELSQYLILPWSKKKRGISVKSLYMAWPLEILEPWLVRFPLSTKIEGRLEKKRWDSASGVVAILADGDLSNYWFDAGRAYLRVSLAIEKAGLSQATSAAIVEASNYHQDIEEKLQTDQRILALIRIGQGHKKRYYSPRLQTQDLIT